MKYPTQTEIAEVLGTRQSAISKRINRKRGFTVDEAITLSKKFNIPVEKWDTASLISTIITESKDQVNSKGESNVPR